MATQFILIDRDNPYILPPCAQNYLPEDHMARFVVDIVDQHIHCYKAASRDRQLVAYR